MKKYLIPIFAFAFAYALIAHAAPSTVFQVNLLPIQNDTQDLGSTTPANEWLHIFTKTLCLGGDCKTAWPNAGGGAFPFTALTNYGALTNATGTPVWFQAGLQASTTSFFDYASTTAFSASNLVSGKCVQASTGGLLTTTGSACGAGGGGSYPFTPGTWGTLAVSGTTTAIQDYAGFISATSTIGTLTASSSLILPYITSALVLTNGSGVTSAYGGAAACSNQFVTAISALGATTCASINNGQWSGTQLSVGNGGTGQTSFLQGWLGINDAGAFVSSTSPTVNYLTATSTTATSSFAYGLNAATVGGCLAVNGVCLANTIANVSAYKDAVNYSSVGPLAANTYSSGVLTEVGTGALTVDGASPSVGQRILVKNEVTGTNNGIYVVTATGSGIAAYVLTRASDFNSSSDIFPGVATYILAGTYLANYTFVVSNPPTIVLDTTSLTFATSSNGNITLPLTVGNGGTGLTSVTDGGLLFGGVGGGGANLAALATSTAGFLTESFTTGRPAWAATSTAFSGSTGQLGFFGSSGGLKGMSDIFDSSGLIGIATTTPLWPLDVYANSLPQLALSAGVNIAHWFFANEGGNLYIGTTTTSGAATSTQTSALTILGSGAPSLSIGSTTQTLSAVNGMLTMGSNGSNGSSTIQTGKWQIDTYNAAGTRSCAYIVGTSWVIQSGACNP